MAVTCEALQRKAGQQLAAAGVENPMLDARLLMQQALNCRHEELIAGPTRTLSASEAARFAGYIKRRIAREPVSHILGTREFWGLSFEVSAAVLDPRPDSETLLEAVLDACSQQTEKKRILDLGTGSGCLLLALLSEYKDSTGIGADISPDALQIARKNAQKLRLDDRAEFVQSDWCAGIGGEFDIIVANPPYIAVSEYEALLPEVREYEPKLALVADDDGLACYRKIVSQVRSVMKKDALLAFEIGVTQADAVKAIVESSGLAVVAIRQDMTGRPRCVLAQQP